MLAEHQVRGGAGTPWMTDDARRTASSRRASSVVGSILDGAVHLSLPAQFDVELVARGDRLDQRPGGIGAQRPAFHPDSLRGRSSVPTEPQLSADNGGLQDNRCRDSGGWSPNGEGCIRDLVIAMTPDGDPGEIGPESAPGQERLGGMEPAVVKTICRAESKAVIAMR